MTNKEQLLKEIAYTKLKLKELEASVNNEEHDAAIRSLEDITDREKCNFFDSMYLDAEKELKNVEEYGVNNEDDEHFAWEVYMSILAKDYDKFWEYYRSKQN
jgi:hypothetical protein